MKAVTCTELRKKASIILRDVEMGETYAVLRHGRTIAQITPASPDQVPAWKRPRRVVTVKGVSLSRMIIKERRRSSR